MPAECHRGGHEAENTLDSAKLDEINPVRKTDDVVGRRFNVWFSLASIKSAGGNAVRLASKSAPLRALRRH